MILEGVAGGMVVYVGDTISMRTSLRVSGNSGRYIKFGGEDGVFSLHRAPNAACADLPRALKFE